MHVCVTNHGTDFKWSIYRVSQLREFEYCYNGIIWAIVWDPNKVMDIRELSMGGGSRLDRFYFIICLSMCMSTYLCAHPPCAYMRVRAHAP